MNIRDLIEKLDSIAEATEPTEFKPTHFHKGNLGNIMPLMLHSDGKFYWQTSNNDPMRGQTGTVITRWSGNPENRSAWNPASVDGEYIDGKPVEYPEGVTYKTFKKPEPSQTRSMAAPAAEPDATAPGIADKVEKLQKLISQYNDASKAPVRNQGGVAAKPSQPEAPIKITQNADGTFSLTKKDGTKLTFDKDGKVLKEEQLSMADMLVLEMNESPDMSMTQIGGAAASGATKAAVAKAGATTASKFIPGVGSTLSAVEAYNRWKAGDRSGAVISALAGIGWLVPGPLGWMLGGGITAYDVGRTLKKDKEEELAKEKPQSGVAAKPSETTPPAAAPKPAEPVEPPKPAGKPMDPKIVALQKYLKSQGADLGNFGPNGDGIDGVIGSKTRQAMKDLNLTESQKMEILRLQLEAIETAQLDERGEAIVKGLSYLDDVAKYGKDVAGRLWNRTKQFVQGTRSPNVTPLPNTGQATNVRFKGPSGSFKAGQAVGRNPVTATVATVGTAGVAGYGLSGGDTSGVAAKPTDNQPNTTAADFQRTDKDTTPVPVPQPQSGTSDSSKPQSNRTTPSDTPSVDLESLKKQIAQLTGEIKGSGVKNSVVDSVVKQAEEILQMTVAPIN